MYEYSHPGVNAFVKMKVVLSLLPVVMATETMVTNPPGECTAKLYPGHGTQATKYKSLPASSASACCVLCQLDDRCGHFVYETHGTNDDSYNEPCHLKEGKNMTLNQKSGCTAGAPDKPAPTPAPTPPPIPPEPPVLGYKPHLIFFLGDDGALQANPHIEVKTTRK